MALVGRMLLGMETPPPPPSAGASAFSSWVATNNAGTAPSPEAGQSPAAVPGTVAHAATEQQTMGSPQTSAARSATGNAAQQLGQPTGQRQTLGP